MPTARSIHSTILRLCFGTLLAAGPLLAASLDASARSSGGYSRSGGSSRTPSFGGGYRGSSGGYRTPSTRSSGGYSRPSSSFNRPRYAPPASAGDSSFSRERSGTAFDDYRRQQQATPQPQYAPRPQQPYSRRPTTRPDYAPSGGWYGNNRGGWYGDRGWAPPPYNVGNRNFGIWDGLFLWALLSNLNRPGTGEWFHNNQNDPGYQEWRREAERQAQDNAELRTKLDELDRQLKERDGQPRTPGTLPADVPPEVAEAQPTRTPDIGNAANDNSGGTGLLLPILAVGVGGAAFFVWRRASRSGGSTVPSSSTPISTAGNILKRKMSGETYTPSKFRVGMTLSLDPTPFVLAGSAIKLPELSGQVSVTAIGRVMSGNTQLVRLYLPDGSSLVQLHLDASGDPDECRLFATIDEVTPADADEWGAWLDKNEGMIGWPDFQTKDGKTYDRVWSPSERRVEPRKFTETIEDLAGTRTVESEVMLYAAATGVPEPGPATEYIMVSALQDAGRASVEIRSGIDINPVTLQLA
ncbi:DUF2491 family protein [Aureimonas leprariae]|uniref:DUF2491 family protein n=1 Tax=Plantimonas leprariae TaxID=2615207 RepID=A0A7V7PQ66_9HYPH|nr:DUF2491 family protein [Aureimonas leprariae]KAB0680157.1 DUF2491 family protein [Aureimonas leprariae]